MHTMDYYSAIKKEQNFALAAIWMDLEGIILSEIIQTKKICDITYVWNLKNTRKLVNIIEKEAHSYTENKLVAATAERRGRGKIGVEN